MVRWWSKAFQNLSKIKFLLALQQGQPNLEWTYNFFAPYHGCSICDGVAAQAKGILNRTMRDQHTAIRTSPEAVTVIGTLANHEASLAQIPSNDFSSATLKGIKQYFKFKAHKTRKM